MKELTYQKIELESGSEGEGERGWKEDMLTQKNNGRRCRKRNRKVYKKSKVKRYV